MAPDTSTAAPAFVRSGGAHFPQTLWSIVIAAKDSDDKRSQEALAKLCQAYWYPIYAFLRRQGKDTHTAKDLTQGFFVHLLEKNKMDMVDQNKGKFRSFLLASLKNFSLDEWKRSTAQKRGGRGETIPLDILEAERKLTPPGPGQDVDYMFEVEWATTLLDRALQRLSSEMEPNRFLALKKYLVGEAKASDYASTASSLKCTQGAVRVAVMRLRQRFRHLLKAEIEQTVTDSDIAEDELRRLAELLTR